MARGVGLQCVCVCCVAIVRHFVKCSTLLFNAIATLTFPAVPLRCSARRVIPASRTKPTRTQQYATALPITCRYPPHLTPSPPARVAVPSPLAPLGHYAQRTLGTRDRTHATMSAAGYHEVMYDDGDQYKGEWNAAGKVRGCCICLALRNAATVVCPSCPTTQSCPAAVWLRICDTLIYPPPLLTPASRLSLLMQRDGYGVLTFADGSRYCGLFSDGMCAGKGVLTFPDNSKYEGEFGNGKYSGFGVYQRADGMKFEGQFKDGQVSGRLVQFPSSVDSMPEKWHKRAQQWYSLVS